MMIRPTNANDCLRQGNRQTCRCAPHHVQPCPPHACPKRGTVCQQRMTARYSRGSQPNRLPTSKETTGHRYRERRDTFPSHDGRRDCELVLVLDLTDGTPSPALLSILGSSWSRQ